MSNARADSLFVPRTSKSFEEAIDHAVRPFVATPLRHVCAREKRQLPNITGGPLAKGVWKFWTFLVARVGPRYRVARPRDAARFSRKVPIGTHARTHACTHARTHEESTTLPYRFSPGRGIFLEGLS